MTTTPTPATPVRPHFVFIDVNGPKVLTFLTIHPDGSSTEIRRFVAIPEEAVCFAIPHPVKPGVHLATVRIRPDAERPTRRMEIWVQHGDEVLVDIASAYAEVVRVFEEFEFNRHVRLGELPFEGCPPAPQLVECKKLE